MKICLFGQEREIISEVLFEELVVKFMPLPTSFRMVLAT